MKYFRNNPFIKSVGLRIKTIRVGLDISQEDLASKLGFRQCQIANIESGKTNASISHIKAIADGLGVPIAELLNP